MTNDRAGIAASVRRRLAALVVLAQLVVLAGCATVGQGVDPLPSWSDTAPKNAIVAFVTKASTEGNPSFVPVAERIAVFDIDGTLWGEQPIYVQIQFAFDRVRALAPLHPQWTTTQPFKAVLDGDMTVVDMKRDWKRVFAFD